MSSSISKSIQQMQRYQSILMRRSLLSKSLTTVANANSNNTNRTMVIPHSQRMEHNFNLHNSKYSMTNITRLNFSTKPDESPQEPTETDTPTITTTTTIEQQSPSILTTLPDNFTPGQAWSAIQIHLAGKQKIRLEDFGNLCRSSRSSAPKDAQVIRTALLDLRRCNDFRITAECAQIALEGIKRSLVRAEGEGETEAEFLVKAGIFVGEIFVEEDAGLYVAAEAKVVNDVVLKTLLEGVESLQVDPVDDRSVDDDGEGEGKGEEDEQESPLAAAANVAKNVIDALILRASNPTKDMKKRAKRQYLKYLRDSSGPTPEMMDVAVKICLKHENAEQGLNLAEGILEAYAERPYLGAAMEETKNLVKGVKEQLAVEVVAEEGDEGEGSDGDEEKEN